MEYHYRQGRSYSDFSAFMEMHPNTSVVEMDTVKSARSCTKALLTLIFPESNFMLVFLMTHATEKCVLSIFDYLTRNHVLIRRFLPKGSSFEALKQDDIHLMVCHLNSYSRELLDNKTPFSLMKNSEQKKLLDLLSLSPVPPDEVTLSPALFKH